MKTRLLLETPLSGAVGPSPGCGSCDGSLREDGTKERTASDVHNLLELRLGISSDSSIEDMAVTTSTSGAVGPSRGSEVHITIPRLHLGAGPGWTNPWLFPEPGNGFVVHPWSLAARQQKAALEKAHKAPQTVTSTSQDLPSPVIGWPPICVFRRKSSVFQPSKVEMEGERDAKRGKTIQEEWREVQQTMLVKVNMEGCVVGRKIDLKIHDSYESLSCALKKLFTNFLSASYNKDIKHNEQVEGPIVDCVLSYEDHAGDWMIIGDVPWEMFITSVKRLYIEPAPKVPKEADGDMVEKKN